MFGIYLASRPPHFLEASDAHETPSHRNGQTFMKDAKYAKTKEKSFFRFLFFELRENSSNSKRVDAHYR